MNELDLASTYNPTQLKKNSSDVFNSVQKDGLVMIESKTRPDMVLMTLDNYESMCGFYEGKIRQLTDLIKAQ